MTKDVALLSVAALSSHGVTAGSIFTDKHAFPAIFNDYTPRPSQITMADAIEEAIQTKKTLVVEAGTGTGKTFAYLVPLLLSGKKIIISTGTKHLQDQLFHKDIPIMKQLAKQTPAAKAMIKNTVLLKGRANYVCLYRLETHAAEATYESRSVIQDLHAIQAWAKATKTGDIHEVHAVAEDSAVWPYVTSTTDNCLGSDCPSYKKCFVNQTRKAALEADVVVVNHHLLFADAMLKEEGFGELLPGANIVMIDEAHQLPEVATHFYGERFSSRQWHELLKDIQVEYHVSAKDMKALPTACDKLKKSLMDLRLAMGDTGQRAPWMTFKTNANVSHVILTVKEQCDFLGALLKEASVRSEGLSKCWERFGELQRSFDRLTSFEVSHDAVHWFETFRQSFVIQQTPLDISKAIQPLLTSSQMTWLFTSATLTTNHSFEHFTRQLGLEAANTLQLDSPFDFASQALLYVPRGLPDPKHPHYTDKVMEVSLPILNASEGRAFMLFTSFRALREAEKALKGSSFDVFVQGDLPKQALLQEFMRAKKGVLLGTNSFWEGVDVRGQALTCVIIDKLPFASPGDPVMKGRMDAFRQKGMDPFQEYQVPMAAIQLKQGVGRLIRDANDKGVLMICDPRLLARHYGETFLKSLPPIPLTRDENKVKAFLEVL